MSTRKDLVGPVKRSKTLAEGRKPGSGRPVGSKDVVLEQLRIAITKTYEALGSEQYLLWFAENFPETFVTKVLTRIMPPVPKEAEVQFNQQNLTVNSELSDFETARRIAFALNKATLAIDGTLAVDSCGSARSDAVKPAPPPPPLVFPPEIPPDYADQELIRPTHEGTLETYVGEQRHGTARQHQIVSKKPLI